MIADGGMSADVASDDSFSPAELAYFESAGEKSEGLFTPPPATEAKADPASVTPAADAKIPAADDSEPGEITIESDGKVRDAKTGKWVPKDAYVRIKTREAATVRERDDLRQQLAAINAKFELTREIIAQEDPAAPSKTAAADEGEPNPEIDIFAHNRWLAKNQARLEGELKKARDEASGRFADSDMKGQFESDVRNFASKQPAFGPAVQYLTETREAELRALGYTDKAQIDDQVRKDLRSIVATAKSAKMNMAEAIYNIAVARKFAPAAAPTESGKSEPGKTPAQEAVEQIKKGQEASRTLANAGGGGAAELTIERFLAMSDAEIMELNKTPNGKAQLKRLGV